MQAKSAMYTTEMSTPKAPRRIAIFLAYIACLLAISCQAPQLVSSESDRIYLPLTEGKMTHVSFPKSSMPVNYVHFQFPTEPGKIYEITVECSTDISIHTDQLTEEYYQVLTKQNWGPQIGDTMVFSVDRPRTSQLVVYTWDSNSTTFDIKLSIQNKTAWWTLPKDSIKNHYKNDEVREGASLVTPYDSGALHDTSLIWETRAFLDPELSWDQRARNAFDSAKISYDWYYVQIDPDYTYTVHFQNIHGFWPAFEFPDYKSTFGYRKQTSDCDEFNICLTSFKLPDTDADRIYFHFSRTIQYGFYKTFDIRYRFGVERKKRT